MQLSPPLIRHRAHSAGLLPVVVSLVVSLVASACGGGASSESPAAQSESPASGLATKCVGHRTAEAEGWVEPLRPGPEPNLPVTVTDVTGQSVTIDDASRILALDTYGTLATTVYALGLGDRLVGRDISTGVPALGGLPVVTANGHELQAEAILDLNPSVILTDYSIGPLEVQLQMKDAGIPVVILDDHRSRATIGEQILAVAAALGVSEAGEKLASKVEADIVAAEAEVAALAEASPMKDLRMVFLYLRGTAGVFYWFGEGSGADDLIASLGGVDVAKQVELDGYKPINAEGLVKAAPDMFLLMSGGLESVGGVSGLAEIPGVAETQAGVNECVVDMADSQILSFGPQYPATLSALGRAVFAEN